MENTEYKSEKKQMTKRMRSVFSHIGFSLFAYDIVTILLTFGITAVISALMAFAGNKEGLAWLDGANYSWLATAVFQFGIGTSVFLALIKIKKPVMKTDTAKRRLKPGAALLVGIVCISIMQVGAYISSFVSAWVETLRGSPLESSLNSLITESNIFVVFIMCVVIGPILEEIIFRKCIIDRMRPFGEWFAVICSALIFGIAHGNFLQLFYSFGIGVMFGVLYVKSNNLKICIGYHMFLNFIGSIIPMLFLKAGIQNEDAFSVVMIGYLLYSLLLFILTIAGITIFLAFAKNIRLEKCKIPGAKLSYRIKAFVFNPGMILVFLTAIASFIMSF